MRVRESGMPDEAVWTGFFKPEVVLSHLGLHQHCGDAVDFGCGYGTFTIPAARIIDGIVYALDLDPAMIDETARKVAAEGLPNVRTVLRDFVFEGSGLDDASTDVAMLLNILHAQERDDLLREAHRVLRPGGTLAIMHWNYDPRTPRGPSMSIRPRPHDLREAAERAGFTPTSQQPIDLPPFHYGWSMKKELESIHTSSRSP